MGGGLEIAAVCDLRIASDSSLFGAAVGKLGFPLAFAETQAVFRVVGPAVLARNAARRTHLSMRSRRWRKASSRASSPTSRSLPKRRRPRMRICESSPLAAHEHKRQIRRLMRDASPVTRDERMAVYSFADSEDYRIGYRAFLEKKKPRFVGR